jgi:electron transfer flavoprotein beta subunit
MLISERNNPDKMKILVCVKQILDTDGPVRIDASRKWIERTPHGLYRMNRFDEYALEEALRIRDAFPKTRIDALSVGPAGAARTLKRALELGVDEGIHIVLDDEGYRMPWETASLIAAYADSRRYDLILAGVMAEDDMQGQVGPMVAVMLGCPWATAVMSQKLTPDGRRIHVERELEGGRREALTLPLPALLTVQSGINRPRYPALSHVMRARSQKIITIDAKTRKPPESRDYVICLEEPAPVISSVFLSGSALEKAEKLAQMLKERAWL